MAEFHIVPECRRARAGRSAVDWRAEWDERHEVHASAYGDVRCFIRVTEVAGETLSFEQTYAFDRETRVSASTLRFASDERIASLLSENGLKTVRSHGDWKGGSFVRERSRKMSVSITARSSMRRHLARLLALTPTA